MYDKFYFIDFDGTITKQDSLDLLFKNYADSSWVINDKKWENGEIGSLENLSYAFSSFDITQQKLDFIIDQLEIDKSFYNLLNYLNKNDYGYIILSEGIDYIIRNTLLKNAPKSFEVKLLNDLKICSNHFADNKISFNSWNNCDNINSCKVCSNCKYIITQQIESKEKIYIGDGLSDRFGILNCDLIYAKGKLVDHCKENKINHIKFSILRELISKI